MRENESTGELSNSSTTPLTSSKHLLAELQHALSRPLMSENKQNKNNVITKESYYVYSMNEVGYKTVFVKYLQINEQYATCCT